MTENTSFKRRVRQRMDRTGERYTTARAHLLATHEPDRPDGLLPGWARTGGLQPDIAASANGLAHLGAHGTTGDVIDEIDVFGLSGGVGFLYGLFVYEGHGPTLTLTTRNDSMPDVTVDQALRRAGVTHRIEETRSAAKAARALTAALDDQRPSLASVDESRLAGHEAAPTDGMPGLPRVVGIVGRAPTGDVLIDDQSPDPISIEPDVLAAARAAPPQSRHRLVVLEGPRADHDPDAALRDALRRSVDGYDEPPAKPFTSNVGTAGLETWAAALRGTGKRSWRRVFADTGHLEMAFERVAAWVNQDLTAPGAGRGLWATFLERAAALPGLAPLEEVATEARSSERLWVAVAEVAEVADATSDPSPPFASMADLVEEIARTERAMLDRLATVLAAGGA